jgi:tetratricopeptide (TPR) repeat protein
MITEQKKQVLQLYNDGLKAYKMRKWDEAIALFSQALKTDPQDGPSKLYYDRSVNYRQTPPPDDWDGVFVMTTK